MKFTDILDVLKGNAHDQYQSEEAKRLYAKQLISLSEKSFWLVIAALLPIFFEPTSLKLFPMVMASVLFMWGGLTLRHTGLKTIDAINIRQTKIAADK